MSVGDLLPTANFQRSLKLLLSKSGIGILDLLNHLEPGGISLIW